MNKKITVLTILFLCVSLFLFPSRKDRQELYLKAVAEKNPETKLVLLQEYVQKYGNTKDKFLRFIYLNLADTSFKLKKYDETIQYGETALGFEELDPTNKLRLYFSLANSFNATKKDQTKALEYTDKIIEASKALIEQAQNSEQDQEKSKQFIANYKNYYIAPAYRLQSMIHYNNGESKLAADKAVEAFKIDNGEKSFKLAFSLAVNLLKKNNIDGAISTAEQVIDPEKPKFREARFLATAYLKKKNKDKAAQYYELAYKAKHKLDLAMRIGRLVHKKQPNKGLRYFADAYILSNFDKTSDAFKYLEQLYFNRIAKDKTPEEKEAGFKQVIDSAKARLGKTDGGEASEEGAANTTE
jgi:hypothetical protein